MARELDTRFRTILRRWVTPTLKAQGFAKQGNVYERIGQGLSWVIDVYRNPLKTPH